MDGIGSGDDFDSGNDQRSAKQPKTGKPDIRPFELCTYGKSLKTAVLDLQLDESKVDGNYMTFLNHLKEYTDLESSESEHRSDNSDCNGEYDVDLQYKMFLENLTVDGTSYILNLPRKNMEPLFIKYESEEVHSDVENDVQLSMSRKLRKFPSGSKRDAAKTSRKFLSKDKIGTQRSMKNPVSKCTMDAMESRRNVKGMEKRNLVAEECLNSEPENHVSGRTNGCSTGKSNGKDNHLFGNKRENKMGDENYQTFLNSITVEGGDGMVFAMEGARPVKYEESENSSDSEVFVTSNASDFVEGNYNPFGTSKVFGSLMEENESNSNQHSQFVEKLMLKLREPYNQKEYEKLWKDITERKLKEGCRDLRGSSISYSKDERNLSYLEQYNGLRRKIDAVQSDKNKVLNLLRGFFFWLQNLVHDDAFPPWMDKACLAVMPGS